MPTVAMAGVVAISLAVALLALAALSGARTSPQVRKNLQRGLVTAQVAVNPVQPAKPSAVAQLAARATPKSRLHTLDRLLAKAGRPVEWPIERLVSAKLVLAVVGAVLGLLYFSAAANLLAAGVGLALTVVGYFLPELLLYSRGQERREKITLALADTLDQMSIAVEAGLSFDGAMNKAGRNGKGPLADELLRTLADLQVGHSRREAYEAFAERTDSPDLNRFVRAVIQADAHGIAIADVLRTQASEMRIKRRQRAEERAMKIPVKVLFPLMFCILPVLFIVLLGPAVMNIVATFS